MAKAGDKLKLEQERQAQIFFDAITTAIEKQGAEIEYPMINALAGALVSVEAQLVNSIPSGKNRKAIMVSLNRQRRKALRKVPGKGNVEIVRLNRETH